MKPAEQHSLGAFKPVGHVVIALPSAAQAQAAKAEIEAAMGAVAAKRADAGAAIRMLTPEAMRAQADYDLHHASPLAALGQELNLMRNHHALSLRGYHWLVVKVDTDAAAAAVAAIAASHGAERAQHYGRLIIEELIERPGGEAQVAESPDRGLDAQTPSGRETEAADLLRQAVPPDHP